MGTAAIEIRGVSKTYRLGDVRVEALQGVDLSIRSGEFLAVMGPSGSGKSTLMNILGCLVRPTSGSYRLDGEEIGDLSRDGRAVIRRNRIGFVFQGFNLLPRLSAQENVELPMIYDNTPAAARRERALAGLAAVVADHLTSPSSARAVSPEDFAGACAPCGIRSRRSTGYGCRPSRWGCPATTLQRSRREQR